jgi:F-type H+-transporting ATPase subunit gamma
MANTKDIRTKIQSTKKTQQTTRAMKMVSAAKLRRAQEGIENARPYANKISEVIRKIAKFSNVEHPLLCERRSTSKVLFVLLTSDRGLCGGFNNSLIKEAKAFVEKNAPHGEKIDVLCIGRRGADALKKHPQVNIVDTILNLVHDMNYPLAANLAEKLWHLYLDGKYDRVLFLYNEFKSAMTQVVTYYQLLPVCPTGDEGVEDSSDGGQVLDFLFEPEAEVILDQLMRKHFAVQVYKSMLDSLASEHGARMTAMESATSNAEEMIEGLTLTYNKLRQAAITTELTEITSGAEALKN